MNSEIWEFGQVFLELLSLFFALFATIKAMCNKINSKNDPAPVQDMVIMSDSKDFPKRKGKKKQRPHSDYFN